MRRARAYSTNTCVVEFINSTTDPLHDFRFIILEYHVVYPLCKTQTDVYSDPYTTNGTIQPCKQKKLVKCTRLRLRLKDFDLSVDDKIEPAS